MARRGFDRRWRTIRIDDPAAGTDWILQAQGRAYWRIVSLVARLVTSATIATRVVSLIGDDGARTWYRQNATAGQAENNTFDYAAIAGSPITAGLPTLVSFALPHDGLLLLPGFRLRVLTSALAAGDQWSAITALVDEIPSDSPYVSNAGLTREVVIQE